MSNFIDENELQQDSRIYEYSSAANPNIPQVPVLVHPAELHQSGPTRIIPFDLSKTMGIDYPATSPNLMASFLRICANEELTTSAKVTSQAFYVIRGAGVSTSDDATISWNEGDLFIFPSTSVNIVHRASDDTAIYSVNDSPLLSYLGVKPLNAKYRPTIYKKDKMLAEVERINHEPGAAHRNRLGILLGNKCTEDSTKTLTQVLWSLLNMLPPKDAQRPHRHNSVALDLCVSAAGPGVYTLMGPELGDDGWVKNPVRCDWKPGAVFVTPPGWWHSHHNETDKQAWVLPMQDAGLYTYQRTLDIQFAMPPPVSTTVPPPNGGLGY